MSKVFQRLQESTSILKLKEWASVNTIDMHTGGEPLRVILSGLPPLSGNSILEKRRYMKENHDKYRKLLMFEPRGHKDMYGCILLPPDKSNSDLGVLFLHNEGYSTMCGHAVIAITKLAVEMKWIEHNGSEAFLTLDAPCGQVKCKAEIKENRVVASSFEGVPSFVVGLDIPISSSTLGKITIDLAYGGAFYAYVNADKYKIDLGAHNVSELIRLGMEIKNSVIDSDLETIHPFENDLSFLYGTIFTSSQSTKADSRNVCIFADGEVDRSPTGSGVSARMAIHYEKGDLEIGDEMKIESIVGSMFTASPIKLIDYASQKAVIPKVTGTSFITGQHQFLFDPEDEFPEGFLIY